MQPIFTKTFTSTSGGFYFNNIPQGFTDLVLKISWRTTATDTGNFTQAVIYCNGEPFPANTHSFTILEGNSSTSYSGREMGSFIRLGYVNSATSSANTFSNATITIPNYTSGNFKQVLVDAVTENNSSAAESVKTSLIAGMYRSSLPITSILLDTGRTNAVNTTVTLYGVSNVYDTNLPSAPTIGTVTDQAGFASIAFTPATNDRADSYVATSTPSGSTTYGASSPIVTPSALGTSYTYRVAAVNSLGTSQSGQSSGLTTDNSYASIATVTAPTGAIGNFLFTNIPQNYRHLQLRFMCRVASGSAGDEAYLAFNGATTEMMGHQMFGDGASTTSAGNQYTTVMFTTRVIGTGSTANAFSVGIIDILDYNNTSKGKTVKTVSGWDANGSGQVYLGSGAWSNLSPVTTLLFRSNSNFAQYSHAALYGIA
jgi:hypothetical protein